MNGKRSEYQSADGAWHHLCYFCQEEVPEDEVREWGTSASTPPTRAFAGATGIIVRAHRRCREERSNGPAISLRTKVAGVEP